MHTFICISVWLQFAQILFYISATFCSSALSPLFSSSDGSLGEGKGKHPRITWVYGSLGHPTRNTMAMVASILVHFSFKIPVKQSPFWSSCVLLLDGTTGLLQQLTQHAGHSALCSPLRSGASPCEAAGCSHYKG